MADNPRGDVDGSHGYLNKSCSRSFVLLVTERSMLYDRESARFSLVVVVLLFAAGQHLQICVACMMQLGACARSILVTCRNLCPSGSVYLVEATGITSTFGVRTEIVFAI